MSNLRGWEFLLLLLLVVLPIAVAVWLAFWIGRKAEEKGYSRVGFTIFGLFFTLIALVVVLVIQPTTAASIAGTVPCPYCAEAIKPEAKVCKHCGRDVPSALPS